MTSTHGGIVQSVVPGSIAEEAGIIPGDVIVTVNGNPIRDVIDYRFYCADEFIEVEVRRGDEVTLIEIEKEPDETLGVEFGEELFDGVRECGNACMFCFVDQLPGGMRQSLYIKDDDYRLSFLHGNFVTLTNVGESDIQRIIEQRLSPLYVSVHATNQEIRSRMLGAKSPDIIKQLNRLSAAGIEIHTQIVLCTGINDGEILEQTVMNLAAVEPGVRSIGIVPVGITKYAAGNLRAVDAAAARSIIADVERWQNEFKNKRGGRLVWASDEIYIAAGQKVPSARNYEGYPQLENGIGILRQFIDKEHRAIRRLRGAEIQKECVIALTGELAAPTLRNFAQRIKGECGADIRVEAVENCFFGRSVTAAGLITGSDIIKHLSKLSDVRGCDVLIPSVMLRDGRFLDDIAPQDVYQSVGCRITSIEPTPMALVESITKHQKPNKNN